MSGAGKAAGSGGWIIGVDGGGTKTLGAIATVDGAIVAQVEVGSTNHHSNALDVVRGNIRSMTEQLLAAAKANLFAIERRTRCPGLGR